MFLKAPQVSLQKVKHSLGIPRTHACSPQTDYAAFLLLYDAPPFGDQLLDAAKIVFGMHLSNNAQAAKRPNSLCHRLLRGTAYSLPTSPSRRSCQGRISLLARFAPARWFGRLRPE